MSISRGEEGTEQPRLLLRERSTDFEHTVADAPAGLIDRGRDEALDLARDRTDDRSVLTARVAVIWQRCMHEKVVRGRRRRRGGGRARRSGRGRAWARLSRGRAGSRSRPVDERLGGSCMREELAAAYADRDVSG